VPKPPFTPGYELVGVVEELGPGCKKLQVGDRIGALTVWGADAERVLVPEAEAFQVPEDIDPAAIVSLLFPYMTAYQVLHRTAKAKKGESVLVHGAAGRVGTALLELGSAAGCRLYGTASERDRAAVEAHGAVAIDYRNEDFLRRVKELTGDGVDVVADSLGGRISIRSFRALRHGGRLVVFGHYSTLRQGRKSRRGWLEWYASTATVALFGLVSPSKKVSAYRIQRIHEHPAGIAGTGGGPRYPEWFGEDLLALVALLREGEIHPVVAERLPFTDARHAHEVLEESASVGKIVLVP
jgi:NADPH2:quinone reductase